MKQKRQGGPYPSFAVLFNAYYDCATTPKTLYLGKRWAAFYVENVNWLGAIDKEGPRIVLEGSKFLDADVKLDPNEPEWRFGNE